MAREPVAGRHASSAGRAGSSEFADAIPLRLHGVPTGLGSGSNGCHDV
ncbi:MAG TPA: hypothetical protein VL485_26765 [Ktedonobacteraceae bacterium]|nr:hypothetical protein [Ktedonobacteraceae bacterium]